MKIRIIPTILTDGVTVVKGANFNNWRTVGNAQATARLYGARDVDELMFLDVHARSKGLRISNKLTSYFSEVLDVPFSVGGGISTIDDARECMRNGAEKVVLGTSAFENPSLISEIALEFGSQAVVVAIDIFDHLSLSIRVNSGTRECDLEARKFAEIAVECGAGELLIQSIKYDGTLCGFEDSAINRIAKLVSVPVIASGGINGAQDIMRALNAGASAVSIGALFQFTETTPLSLANELEKLGVSTRSR